jgi:tetratricopeptide (TPR) repeat protein
MPMRWVWGIAALLAWAAPAQARWLEAETPHFTVYSDGTEAKLREFARLLEDYDALLRLLTGTPAEAAPTRLRVYLVRGPGALREVRDVPSTVAGMYVAAPGGSAAFAIRRDSGGEFGIEGEDVVLHEYAHHFMTQHYPYAYPAWYVEGFAEYLMTADFSPTRIEIGRFAPNRGIWLAQRQWISAEDLLTKRVGELRGDDRAMFYAQAWLAVHYINRTPGKLAALRAYLKALGAGTPAPEAFRAGFGTDFAGFQRELRRYAGGRMTYTAFDRAAAAAAAPLTLRALPPAADDLLLPLASLRAGVGERWKAERLAQVRRDAARHPGDAFAERVLALAEAQLGDPAAAIGVADRLLARDPADPEALLAKATALAGQARDAADPRAALAQARQHFVRANKAAPNQVPILYGYALAQLQGGRPNRNILDVLLLCRRLAPQVTEIGLLTAHVAMTQGEFEAAENILRPIAYNPHGSELAAAAMRMIEAARQRRVEAPPGP